MTLTLKKFTPLLVDKETCDGLTLARLEEEAQGQAFVPCGPSQQRSIGLDSVFDGGTYVRHVAGAFWVQVRVEKKSVPASAVKARLDEWVQEVQEREGRKVGRKEKKEMKERVKEELLVKAIPTQSTYPIVLDAQARRVLIGATTGARLDQAVSVINSLVTGIELANPEFDPEVSKTLGAFLLDEDAGGDFSADSTLALKNPTNNAAARFSQCNLHVPEIQAHLKSGMAVQSMDLTFDGRLSFNLNSNCAVSKVKLLDMQEDKSAPADAVEELDGYLFLQTEECRAMVSGLLDWLSQKEPAEQFRVAA